MQLLHAPYDIALQEEDDQVPADMAQKLYPLDALLMQVHLPESGDDAVVVLRPLPQPGFRSGKRLWAARVQQQHESPLTLRRSSTVMRPI